MHEGRRPDVDAQLIATLRRLRELSGLSQKAVAERLDWHDSKIFRIETGRTHLTRTTCG
ncbi:MAG TPA: helix-turn-helix transcriptional regulator [Streptosporangiaceae bacterium]|nr:helix-turn-helix transcriptional regulator [Streptosporangiaceae bacterium]